jgi:hypothetical protein
LKLFDNVPSRTRQKCPLRLRPPARGGLVEEDGHEQS